MTGENRLYGKYIFYIYYTEAKSPALPLMTKMTNDGEVADTRNDYPQSRKIG